MLGMVLIFALLIIAFTIGGLYRPKPLPPSDQSDDGIEDLAALEEAERQAANFQPQAYVVVAKLTSQQGYDEAVVNGLIAFLEQNNVKANYAKLASGSIGTDVFQIRVIADSIETAAPLIEKFLNEN